MYICIYIYIYYIYIYIYIFIHTYILYLYILKETRHRSTRSVMGASWATCKQTKAT